VSELTSELQRMAGDAARLARPPAAAEIIRQGDRRRRQSRRRRALGGLAAAGIAGAATALSLGLAGSAPAHGTIRTAGFTLVSNANGTATLSMNPMVVLEPGILQSDLARYGIRAMVTAGSFCSSDPPPAGIKKVIKFAGSPGNPGNDMVINPAAMPAGTELSFGYFRRADGVQTSLALISMRSYTCTTDPPPGPPPDGVMIGA
jgi:hypothetical protein